MYNIKLYPNNTHALQHGHTTMYTKPHHPFTTPALQTASCSHWLQVLSLMYADVIK